MTDVLPEIAAVLTQGAYAPDSPNLAVKPLLQDLARQLPKKAKDASFASACLAGLWLYHDFLDESHTISQELDTLEGSYWHALMHRREPDYGNAKYWFRRVPTHPIFSDLCQAAATLTDDAGTPAGSEFLVRQKTWNAAAFVDFCEAAPETPLGRAIQLREWELLFQYCHQRAFPASRAP